MQAPGRAGPFAQEATTARLTKREVERLLADYDADPVAALTASLRRLTGLAGASWDELVPLATSDHDRRAALLAADGRALDDLARELNELRQLDAHRLAVEASRGLGEPWST